MYYNTLEKAIHREVYVVWVVSNYSEVLVKDYKMSKLQLELEQVTFTDNSFSGLIQKIESELHYLCRDTDLELYGEFEEGGIHYHTYLLKVSLSDEQRKVMLSGSNAHFYYYKNLIDKFSAIKMGESMKECFYGMLSRMDSF